MTTDNRKPEVTEGQALTLKEAYLVLKQWRQCLSQTDHCLQLFKRTSEDCLVAIQSVLRR